MKKIICVILITILIISLFLPIISNASNSIDNNILENELNENVINEDVYNNIQEDNVVVNEIVENSEFNNENLEEISDDLEYDEHNEIKNNNAQNIYTKQELGVLYSAHVQDIGWQNSVSNGEGAGTIGRNLKVEALKIELIKNTSDININYSAYVQGIGWQNSISNGEVAGTTGRNLKMEAIKIWLTGTNEHSVMYRTHIQDYGWQDWKYDGTISGNLLENKKIEAIEIKIVPKVQKRTAITYSSHIQDIGWQEEKQEYDISGTTGRNLKIEALKISFENVSSGISVKYRTYVENVGWQRWKQNGEISGTTGQNLRIFGIRIQLEGTKKYSIYYRAHIQDIGWSTWKKNGEVVGDISNNKKIEAIQIKIVEEQSFDSNSIGVEYYTYLKGTSDNENKIERNGDISGTTGQNRIMDALQIELINVPSNYHIKYKTHIEDKGWLNWVKDGQVSGIKDSNLKIEAVQIELENMPNYTVEYKVHVQDSGWTGWCIDGEVAGTTGKNLKIEAIQIRIVSKYKRYYKGIDVSYWQEEINFDKLVATKQVDYMIARIGWYSDSRQKLMVDTQFERNYREARKRSIPLGAYVYSYAMSVEGAKKEAETVVNYLKSTGQINFELPIFFDIEDDTQISLGKDIITQMSIVFCETLKKAGFNVGVYSYSYWLENYMNLNSLPRDYSIWVAHYDKNHDGNLPNDIFRYSDKYHMWQYSSKGKVDGIKGDVDMNVCYRKYF